MHAGRERIPIVDGRSDGLRAVDIDVGLAQHPGGFERGHRVATQVEGVFRAHLHPDFDRSELLVFVRHNLDFHHVADIDATQAHRGAHAYTARIVEIGFEGDMFGEETARPRHQKQQ